MIKPNATNKMIKKPAEQIAIRFLIDHPKHGWQQFPTGDVMAIYSGQKPIPDLADHTVWIAIAHVALESRKVQSLGRLQIDSWAFDTDGRVNQKPVIAKIVEKLHPDRSGETEKEDVSDTMDDVDVNAIRIALGLMTE
jgi:hypothetical protein